MRFIVEKTTKQKIFKQGFLDGENSRKFEIRD